MFAHTVLYTLAMHLRRAASYIAVCIHSLCEMEDAQGQGLELQGQGLELQGQGQGLELQGQSQGLELQDQGQGLDILSRLRTENKFGP